VAVSQAKSAYTGLIGTDDAAVDDKGRLFISARKRERLGQGFAMYLGETGCIFAVPGDDWEAICIDMSRYDQRNPGTMEYSHEIMGSATDNLKFDQQGRIVIPKDLRDEAKIRERVKIIGCNTRLEIWAVEEHELFKRDTKNYAKERRDRMAAAYREMIQSCAPSAV
jgi:MraZ protein